MAQKNHVSASVLKTSLSQSLSRLGTIRADLLAAWARRNVQTSQLEEAAAERIAELETITDMTSPRAGESHSTLTSPAVEPKRAGKIHKIQKSVGGKLRDLLSSSSSSANLSSIERGERGDKPRQSLDMGMTRANPSRSSLQLLASPIEDLALLPSSFPPVAKSRRSSSNSQRPTPISRHSMHVHRPSDYISPFVASQAGVNSIFTAPAEMMPTGYTDIRRVEAVGGVGGLGAGGDEDDKRIEAGRKREGMLWGAGTWEGLTSKPSAKSKWERKLHRRVTLPPELMEGYWVVLDHSSIYEYQESVIDRPDSAHEIIDLKFASVREGRGTDRRFGGLTRLSLHSHG